MTSAKIAFLAKVVKEALRSECASNHRETFSSLMEEHKSQNVKFNENLTLGSFQFEFVLATVA